MVALNIVVMVVIIDSATNAESCGLGTRFYRTKGSRKMKSEQS